MWAPFILFKETAQRKKSATRRKFAKSGHLVEQLHGQANIKKQYQKILKGLTLKIEDPKYILPNAIFANLSFES
jgi:hypothetical protein